MQMEDYLYQKNLYQLLVREKHTYIKKEEWDLLDHKALKMIRLTLSRLVAFNVKNQTTIALLMEALSNLYK